jgi:hypothetical protein
MRRPWILYIAIGATMACGLVAIAEKSRDRRIGSRVRDELQSASYIIVSLPRSKEDNQFTRYKITDREFIRRFSERIDIVQCDRLWNNETISPANPVDIDTPTGLFVGLIYDSLYVHFTDGARYTCRCNCAAGQHTDAERLLREFTAGMAPFDVEP